MSVAVHRQQLLAAVFECSHHNQQTLPFIVQTNIRAVAGMAAAAVAANGGGSVKGLRDAALLAVMSDAMLRVSEATALDVADLEAEGGNTLTVRRSKTDQESAGAAQYIGEPTVARVRAWMAAAGIEDGPLFQRLDKAGQPRGRLSTQSIRAIIQRRAQDAGIEGRVSGHSLRVGSAQSLATAGASVVELQQAGRWRSPAMPGPLRPPASWPLAEPSPACATVPDRPRRATVARFACGRGYVMADARFTHVAALSFLSSAAPYKVFARKKVAGPPSPSRKPKR